MEKVITYERNISSAAVTERNCKLYSQRRGYLDGQDSIDILDKLIESSRIAHYNVTKILIGSDPDNYREMLPKICYVLCLTQEDRKKRTIPLTDQLYRMPLDELICHCLLVFDETEENLEHEKRKRHNKDAKKIRALRLHLNELNHLVQYIHRCLAIYLNRRKNIFIMLRDDEMDEGAVQEFNEQYFKETPDTNEEAMTPINLEHINSNST